MKQLEGKLSEINREYGKIKLFLDQKGYSRARRMNTPTTFEMISDPKSSTRYRRRQDTTNILEFIHGGEEPSIYGAWDHIASHASKPVVEKLVCRYKRRKFLQGMFGKAMTEYGNSEEALKQAASLKFQSFLSRRTFELVCRIQSSVFNAEKDIWMPRNASCAGVKISLPRITSDDRVCERFKSW